MRATLSLRSACAPAYIYRLRRLCHQLAWPLLWAATVFITPAWATSTITNTSTSTSTINLDLSMGVATLTPAGAAGAAGPVTVFYPSSGTAQTVNRGPFTLQLAVNGPAVLGNRRLVVFSHGSGGAPWPMADLARSFVNAGYTVALPEHAGDNYRDQHLVGPASWKLRPAEVSHAIDAVLQDNRFAKQIDFEQVGVYGTSAGGLTALVLGGGTWSPANFKRYCLAHMKDDFAACVGLIVQLKGNWSDAIKLTVASWVHRLRFNDETKFSHHDGRIQAVLASVPMGAPFDMASFAQPRTAVGLVVAGQDQWLAPAAHARAVQAACPLCTVVLDMPQAGHGSLFSPWPVDLAQSLSPLLVDPPGFARSELPAAYQKIVAFFNQQLKPVPFEPAQSRP